ncbi:DUF3823 domain-containing protein [Parabacteroides pacaensis]|uniref:DUF3823 domain-containing protein n=1 Tax=Parabacteroides pacaensis TaxID=2086575 RepID=UPI000D0F4C2C|nr:DUF3823 domain-containing protein [Parabacteroides pacaensis]
MKQIIYILFLLALCSCGLDNFDEPSSVLSGKVTYQGESIGVKGSGQKVQMQLYQDGYALKAPIPVYVSQDGSFQAVVFDGVYKLVSRDNNGPWVNKRDTVVVTVKGATQCEYPVTPYYIIKNEKFSVEGNLLRSTCDIRQITEGKSIASVYLLINKTAFVDEVSSVARTTISKPGDDISHIQLEMDLRDRTEEILYARIGIQISGVSDILFSKIERIR